MKRRDESTVAASTGDIPRSDPELSTLARIERGAALANISFSPFAVSNMFVCLKSRPLALLTGPAIEPKETLIKILATEIAGTAPNRVQTMSGHAWWADRSGDIARFTHAQAVLNERKIAALMDEACQPENRAEIFIACLLKISPAELAGCFAVLERLAAGKPEKPPPGGYYWPGRVFPPNLRIIGSLDTDRFPETDTDLLSQTSLINDFFGLPSSRFSPQAVTENLPGGGLGNPIRNENGAYRRLQQIPGWRPERLKPGLELAGALIRSGIPLRSRQVTAEMLVYLANAWSRAGNGLFAPEPSHNLEIALDQAMTQSLLSRVGKRLSFRSDLGQQLSEQLGERYPRSRRYLEQRIII